eukprot:8799827-Karenia_brevis.AAC.1
MEGLGGSGVGKRRLAVRGWVTGLAEGGLGGRGWQGGGGRCWQGGSWGQRLAGAGRQGQQD